MFRKLNFLFDIRGYANSAFFTLHCAREKDSHVIFQTYAKLSERILILETKVCNKEMRDKSVMTSMKNCSKAKKVILPLKIRLFFRHSMVLPPTTETSKYSREQQIKEIHNSFMKNYKETNTKLNGNQEENERKSKAYQKIVNNAPPSYMDEREAKKQTLR